MVMSPYKRRLKVIRMMKSRSLKSTMMSRLNSKQKLKIQPALTLNPLLSKHLKNRKLRSK